MVPTVGVSYEIQYLSLLDSLFLKAITTPKFYRLLISAAQFLEYEAHFCPNLLDALITVSEFDGSKLLQFNPDIRLYLYPIGLDLDYLSSKKVREDNGTVIFVANFEHPPNISACVFFLDKIWPLVISEIPDAKFHVVGRNPDSTILEKAEKFSNVLVAGEVDDIRDYVLRAAVSVAPIKKGYGVRVKFLEAMAMGRAIVSTPRGAVGTGVRHNEHFLCGRTPKEFAGHVIRLLRDKDLRHRLGTSALQLARDRFSFEAATERYEAILYDVIENFPKTGQLDSGPTDQSMS